MIHSTIYEDLKGKPCVECENLSYWDGYYCKIDSKFIDDKNTINCEEFKPRELRDVCKEHVDKCKFWCLGCPAWEYKQKRI